MTDASTAQILKDIMERSPDVTTLVSIAGGLYQELKRRRILAPWAQEGPYESARKTIYYQYFRSFWGINKRTSSSMGALAVIEQGIKKGPEHLWEVKFSEVVFEGPSPPSPFFALPKEAQAWADEQLIKAGYTLLPQGYNQEATP